MNLRKASVFVCFLALAVMLLAPLFGCDQHRRYSRWSRYDDSRNTDYQRELAADQWRRNHEEQRRQDRERGQDRGNY